VVELIPALAAALTRGQAAVATAGLERATRISGTVLHHIASKVNNQTAMLASYVLDWHSGLGLAQKADDLLFAVFAGSHVHHSPMRWTSWKNGWYGLWGAGHRAFT
jgi:hypothetical protein